MDPDHTKHYGGDQIKGPKGDEYRYSGCYPRYFELTPELEQQLGIIEHENLHFYKSKGKGADYDKQGPLNGTVRMATNWKLYDQLNHPLIKAHVDKHKRSKASKAGADKPAPKRDLTPAEKKSLAKEHAEQLQKRIDAWRHDWLKSLVAARLPDFPLLQLKLLIVMALDDLGDRRDFQEPAEIAAVDIACKQAKCCVPWDVVEKMPDEPKAIHQVVTALVGGAIAAEDRDPKYPAIERERMQQLAELMGIDIAKQWAALQDAHQDLRLNGDNDAADSDRFACFFELFQSGQLDELGQELGVHVADAKSKDAKVKILSTRDRTLKLPKCIKPLAGSSAKRKKGRGK